MQNLANAQSQIKPVMNDMRVVEIAVNSAIALERFDGLITKLCCIPEYVTKIVAASLKNPNAKFFDYLIDNRELRAPSSEILKMALKSDQALLLEKIILKGNVSIGFDVLWCNIHIDRAYNCARKLLQMFDITKCGLDIWNIHRMDPVIVKILLEDGRADPTIRGNEVLKWAVMKCNKEVIGLLDSDERVARSTRPNLAIL